MDNIEENKRIDGYLCSFNLYKMGFLVKKDIIYVIYCANPYYHTEKGIRVGDNAQKISMEFGDGQRLKRPGHDGYIIHFPGIGINFVINQYGKIEQIQIQ